MLPSVVKRLSERGEAATPENAKKLFRETIDMDVGPRAYMRRICLHVFFRALSIGWLEKMQARVVGRLDLNEGALRTDFPFIYAPKRPRVETGLSGFYFIRRRALNPEDVYVAGFHWPIAQYVDKSAASDRLRP